MITDNAFVDGKSVNVVFTIDMHEVEGDDRQYITVG